jgi:hypothetical protein
MAVTQNNLSEYKHWQPEFTKIIDGKAVRFRDVCVHTFSVGDVDDPDIYAAGPIWDWQQTEAGKFVMSHAVGKPYWIQSMDSNSWGHVYKIIARLGEPDQLFWTLKWSGR